MGVFVWTALEYKTHRFDLHDQSSIQDNMSQDKIERHHVHHMFANQDKIIVIPLWEVIGTGAMIWAVAYCIFGVVPAGAFASGMTLAQIFYDSMHYWFHFGGDFKFKTFQDLKEKHMKHHYRDKNRDFGVSTSFWDHVFDTV